MAFNIKSDETHQLAREVADLTGESMSKAVDTALRERKARLTHRSRFELTMELARQARLHASDEWRAKTMSDFDAELYDEESGLPK